MLHLGSHQNVRILPSGTKYSLHGKPQTLRKPTAFEPDAFGLAGLGYGFLIRGNQQWMVQVKRVQ